MPIVAAVAVPHPPIILPGVGNGEEKKIQKTADAFEKAMAFLEGQKPEAVVVISPHADMYTDWFVLSPGQGARGDMARFGAPETRVSAEYDTGLAEGIEAAAHAAGLPAGRKGERESALDHGSLVPLWFLDGALKGYKAVRIGLSGLPLADHYRLGQCIAAAAGEKRVAVIASGDLAHRLREDGPYGFAPEGPKLDKAICKALAAGDFEGLLKIDPVLAEKGGECGLRSFVMMAGALDGRAVEAELLSYEGPFGVGYAVATFLPGAEVPGRRALDAYEEEERARLQKARAGEDAFVRLARHSVETFVKTGEPAPLPGGLPKEMTEERAGVFVSLHKGGELRGCIGTIAPVQGSVAQEILHNAVSACSQDPRFAPVRVDELPWLEIHVDVLGEPEPVASEAQLDPARYGVIVSKGLRRGLLLPDLEGVDTVRRQVDIAKQKAGLAGVDDVQLERFSVIRHGE